MRKRCMSIIVMIMMEALFGLSACRKTPEMDNIEGVTVEKESELTANLEMYALNESLPDTCELQITTDDGTLNINAQICVPEKDNIEKGTLELHQMDWEAFREILCSEEMKAVQIEEGFRWGVVEDSDGKSDPLMIKYFDLSEDNISFRYVDDTIGVNNSMDYTIKNAMEDKNEAERYIQMADDLMKKLDLFFEGQSVCLYTEKDGTEWGFVQMNLTIDGIDCATDTYSSCLGRLAITSEGEIALLQVVGNFEKKDGENCRLAPWDDILQRVSDDIAEQKIFLSGEREITQIALEYWLEEDNGGIEYVPVWSFKVADSVDNKYNGTNIFLAINAVTGEIEYCNEAV